MLGKTNIIYVTKDQNSEMQFVTETIVTRSSSAIVKIKYLNETFFAITKEGSVLYGEDINSLNFLMNENQIVTASNVQYFEGKYVFININNGNLCYCVSEDLTTFQWYELPESISNAVSNSSKKIMDIAIDSYNRLVFLAHIKCNSSTLAYYFICTCSNPKDVNSIEARKVTSPTIGSYTNGILFMRDRFLVYTYENDTKKYYHCITMDAIVEKIEEGHYPIGILNDMAYACAGSNTYYSLNFKDYIKIKSSPSTQCFLIGGRIGLYNDGILELASKVTDFAAGKSVTLEITGIDYKVLCCATTDKYTYLGCEGGIVIQCLLDIDGIYQTPEVTLVKTLAAKQALDQAKKYADEKFAELKNYVDSLNGSSN